MTVKIEKVVVAFSITIIRVIITIVIIMIITIINVQFTMPVII